MKVSAIEGVSLRMHVAPTSVAVDVTHMRCVQCEGELVQYKPLGFPDPACKGFTATFVLDADEALVNDTRRLGGERDIGRHKCGQSGVFLRSGQPEEAGLLQKAA
jgi:hypothetical protein